MAKQSQAYQNSLAQSMLNTKQQIANDLMRNAYPPGMAVQITERPEQSTQGFWTSIIGGKK
jgi:hypothetical protein